MVLPQGGKRQPLSRKSITVTAKKLFSQQGYASTTIEDIADCMGVRKGAVYYHVPRKSDLLVEVVAELLRPIALRAEEIARRDLPPTQKLEELVRNHVTCLLENREAAQVFFEQYHQLPPDDAAGLKVLSAQIESAFESVLAQGMSMGRFSTEAPKLLTMHVLALCNWPYRWFDRGGPYSIADVGQSVWTSVYALVTHDSIDEAL